MMPCGFRALREMRKQKCDCTPVIVKRQMSGLKKAWKTQKCSSDLQRGGAKPQGVGSRCRRRGALPWVRQTGMGVRSLGPSWQFFLQLKLGCSSVSRVELTSVSYLLPFAIQKEKHILCLLAWFHVIKEGCGKAGWGHVIKWHKGIKQESKLKNPKVRPSRIIKEVVKQRGSGLLVSWRTAERAG